MGDNCVANAKTPRASFRTCEALSAHLFPKWTLELEVSWAGRVATQVPRQELLKAVDGTFGDALQNMAQVWLRIKSVELRRAEQGVHGGGAFTAGVRASEEIVLASESDDA